MAKPGRDSARELVQAVFDGARRTARLFDKATGGCLLDEACEYLLTAGVFERLAQRDRGPVHVEVPVKECRLEAKAVKRGPPGQAERINGRFDLVHYWADGRPRAAIEVKLPVRNAERRVVCGDFARLASALTANRESSYQFCAFVFYATKPYRGGQSKQDARKGVEEKLRKLMASIDGIAKEYVSHRRNPLIRRLYVGKVNHPKDQTVGAWQIGVVVFARKHSAPTFPAKLSFS